MAREIMDFSDEKRDKLCKFTTEAINKGMKELGLTDIQSIYAVMGMCGTIAKKICVDSGYFSKMEARSSAVACVRMGFDYVKE